MEHIIKREGHKEKFDERKVYGSCYAACRATQMPHHECETTCDKICAEIKNWIKKKKEATSDELFREIAKTVKKYNEKAAFMYETHRDIA